MAENGQVVDEDGLLWEAHEQGPFQGHPEAFNKQLLQREPVPMRKWRLRKQARQLNRDQKGFWDTIFGRTFLHFTTNKRPQATQLVERFPWATFSRSGTKLLALGKIVDVRPCLVPVALGP